MKTTRFAAWCVVLQGLSFTTITATARADHDWLWPVYSRVTGNPRPVIGTSHGQWQIDYMHPGVDIVGDDGDYVVLPVDGTVERTFNYEDHCAESLQYCRVYAKTLDGRYLVYFSHIDIRETPPTGYLRSLSEVREQVANAYFDPTSDPSERTVVAGQILATLTKFSDTFDHLHIGVVDRMANYDSLDPTTFFGQEPGHMVALTLVAEPSGVMPMDDEPPTIHTLEYVQDGTSDVASTDGECGREVSGSVDVVAKISDTFVSDQGLEPYAGLQNGVNNIGIRDIRLAIRSLATGEILRDDWWYDAAQVPLKCGAPHKGADCPNNFADDDAFYALITDPNEPTFDGGPVAGVGVIQDLFIFAPYYQPGVPGMWHNVAHAQGVLGTWDTTSVPDGLYEVTVVAYDFANNTTPATEVIVVHNGTDPVDCSGASPPTECFDPSLQCDAGTSCSSGGCDLTVGCCFSFPSDCPVLQGVFLASGQAGGCIQAEWVDDIELSSWDAEHCTYGGTKYLFNCIDTDPVGAYGPIVCPRAPEPDVNFICAIPGGSASCQPVGACAKQ